MANVLDLRRRIRSVKNTRQITKAMKMVSAAKLRRAQERALAARPYARMIASVLQSLTRRVDLFDEKTGNLRHPLFVTRPEKRVLLIVISGDKGFAGAFNANILKTAYQFINGNPDKEIDVEAVGRKGRDQMRRRYPVAVYTEQTDENGQHASGARARARAQSKSPATIPACCSISRPRACTSWRTTSSPATCTKRSTPPTSSTTSSSRSSRSALVVEKLLPLIEIGSPQIAGAVEPTAKRRSAPPKPRSPPASRSSPPTPPRPTRKPRNSAPPTLTTSTSSPPRSSSPACSRNTFFPCCSTP